MTKGEAVPDARTTSVEQPLEALLHGSLLRERDPRDETVFVHAADARKEAGRFGTERERPI